MKIKMILLAILLFPSIAIGATYNIVPPGLTLFPPEGPFGFGGRGFVFTANEDFTMTSVGMDLSFTGTLDFAVEIYQVIGGARGSLLSSTQYPGLTDDGSAFFTLNHTHTYTTGQTYEIMFRYSSPGAVFPHYDFDNPSLDPANGFAVGTLMTVLDGSDFSAGQFGNSWLANFQLTTRQQTQVAIPTLNEWGVIILLLGMLGATFHMMRKQRSV